MRQQREAQRLNAGRMALQSEQDALAARMAALGMPEAAAAAAAAPGAAAKKRGGGSDESSDEGDSDDDDDDEGGGGGKGGGGGVMESAAQVRQRYLRTMAAQEAELAARRDRYVSGLSRPKKGVFSYSDDVEARKVWGPDSYRPSQLPSYKACAQILEEVVKDVCEDLFSRNETTVPERVSRPGRVT